MSKRKAPAGFVLTKHDGYHVNARGFRLTPKQAKDARENPDNPNPRQRLMADGAMGVSWFNEDEPYIAAEKDGVSGYSPNCQVLPIVDGWVPPVYTLHTKEEAP